MVDLGHRHRHTLKNTKSAWSSRAPLFPPESAFRTEPDGDSTTPLFTPRNVGSSSDLHLDFSSSVIPSPNSTPSSQSRSAIAYPLRPLVAPAFPLRLHRVARIPAPPLASAISPKSNQHLLSPIRSLQRTPSDIAQPIYPISAGSRSAPTSSTRKPLTETTITDTTNTMYFVNILAGAAPVKFP
ncbi:hypothetical protein N7476_010200 [Penicillium atrosanguineum]|uniref:Uncharacterized protein n=1 Tax=Penicillium atrosanguineum TaxID=1132637 RepID=A0A9W9PPP9_9EURO|nr:hypothetical protein N7476_010200 [Penicillium atrosanguineum]